MPKNAPKKVTRSEYLAAALEQMRANPPEIRSGGQLAANLLAQGITGWAQGKAERGERAEAEAAQQRMIETAQGLGYSPEQIFMLQQMGGEEFAKTRMQGLEKAAEPFTMSPGQVRFGGGGQAQAAVPDVKQFGGGIFQTGPSIGLPQQEPQPQQPSMQGAGAPPAPMGPPPGGMQAPQQPPMQGGPFAQQIGVVPPTFSDQTGRMGVEETIRHNPVMEGIAQGQLGVSRGQLGVSQGNLDLSRQRFSAEQQTGGGSGALSAIEAELRRRGAIP